ncbi:MbtH-like protein [Streptomyces sp. YIM 130001]|uniref:MbtH family protein n=1 Tax=Streptomyces sp. YIM 130001 TaxID=2259644 RepID=UPI000E64B51E|nr:MbtH family protein [Streptomyces sp. YIM 130001]RII13775.1 MbtH-like protein [Streptomyces sp. YIM 130001]
MSSNPFDDTEGVFHVLVNDEGQHSLWPSFSPVPAGWTPTLSDVDRETALAHIERTWPDIRPLSVRATGAA